MKKESLIYFSKETLLSVALEPWAWSFQGNPGFAGKVPDTVGPGKPGPHTRPQQTPDPKRRTGYRSWVPPAWLHSGMEGSR